MRLALVHASELRVEPGAPAVADPREERAVERTDCLLALAGVEPEDLADGAVAGRVADAAAELRCESVVLAFCPALVDAAADRERVESTLRALADGIGGETAVAPTDHYLAFDLETPGHPHAVRAFRPGERSPKADFDPTPLEAAGLANATDAGLAWTPAGTVARRALLENVAERFARAGAEPVDPPLLPDRGETPESAPEALAMADPPVLLRPRATFGARSEAAVYATGPAFGGSSGVYRPEAVAPDGVGKWLELADGTLRALGFAPEVTARAKPRDTAAVREALDARVTEADTTRVEFHTSGPTAVVERTPGGVRCVPVGTARRALAALAPELPLSLAPTQLRLVPIDGTEARCRSLASSLAARADVDDRGIPTGDRLSDAESVPFVAVVGPEDNDLSVAGPDGEERLPENELDARIREEIPGSEWPPVRARRPLRLSAHRQ